MLCVKHTVKPSEHGLGLFAAEPIAQGALVYRHDDTFVFPVHLDSLPEATRGRMAMFSYRGRPPHQLAAGWAYFNADDSRFMNHSDAPSLVYDPATETYHAAVDLAEGDEMTCDYRDFAEQGEACFSFPLVNTTR